MVNMKKFYGQMVAAEVYISGGVSVNLITPFEDARDGYTMFYWDTGPSRCYALFVDGEEPLSEGEARVLHVYGVIPDDDEAWDAVDLHFLTTYYPAEASNPPAPDPAGTYFGWISPTGDYYMASYGDHDATARTIIASLYGEVLDGYKAREMLMATWLQCRNDGRVYGRNDNYDLTESQAKTIKLIEAASGVNYGRTLKLRAIVPDPPTKEKA